MFWLFALGIITLATFHPRFRKVALLTAAAGGVAFVLYAIIFVRILD